MNINTKLNLETSRIIAKCTELDYSTFHPSIIKKAFELKDFKFVAIEVKIF